MDERTALPAWIIFLLIALGVALAVGVALLFTQMDTYQQRSMLPQATLPVVDSEATVAAGDLTVVVIVPDEFVTSTPSPTDESPTPSAEGEAADITNTPIFVPTCAAAPDGWVPYTVVDGDTLASLSTRFNESVAMISLANCTLEEGQLVSGQVIFVPSLTPTPTSTPTADGGCRPPEDWFVYVVQEGDTLVGLANQRDTTVHELIEVNCLDTIALTPGQELFVPKSVMPGPAVSQDLSGPPMKHGLPLPPMMPPMPKPPMFVTPGWPPPYRPTPVFPHWPTATSWPTPEIPIVTVTLPASPTPSYTPTTEMTATATQIPPATVAATALPTTATTQPTATSTATFTPTAIATEAPSATPTNTLEPTPTVTVEAPTPTMEATATVAAEEPTPTETATALPTPIITPDREAYPYP